MVERLEPELGHRALGSDDNVEAFVQPDRRAVIGDVGQPQHQRLQRLLLLAQLAFELTGLGAGLLGPGPKRGFFLGRSALEAGADRIALGPQRLDLGLEPAHLAVEAEQLVEIEIDALVANRLVDRRAIGLDEIQSQHGCGTARIAPARQASR